MTIYLLQFDTSIPFSKFQNIIEKLGDFCIYKTSYIINTEVSKVKLKAKFKRVLSKDDHFFVKEIKEEDLPNFPFVIKEWFYKNTQKEKTNRIEENYELIKQDALNKLNEFLDHVKEELDKQ